MQFDNLFTGVKPHSMHSLTVYHKAQGLVGIMYIGITGEHTNDAHTHCIGVHDVVLWKHDLRSGSHPLGIIRAPPNVASDAWVYVVTHFGVGRRKIDPFKLSNYLTQFHAHLFDCYVPYLDILDLVASYLQYTPFSFKSFLWFTASLSTGMAWSSLNSSLQQSNINWWWVGDVVVQSIRARSAAFAWELWVKTAMDAITVRQLVLAQWRGVVFDITDAATTATRQGAPPLIIRVVPREERWHELMKLQPDFRQCIWHPSRRLLVITARAMRAILTDTSCHSPASTTCHLASLSGFKIEGGPSPTSPVQSSPVKLAPPPAESTLDLSQFQWYPDTHGYFRVTRMFVTNVHPEMLDAITPAEAPMASVYDALRCHLSNVRENGTLRVIIADATIYHGMTNDQLLYVPRGCSISGNVWFKGDLTMCDGARVPLFHMYDVYVHPSHLPYHSI